MFNVIEYIDADGYSPFEKWFSTLDHVLAIKVTKALYLLEQGLIQHLQNLGNNIMEFKDEIESAFSIYLIILARDTIVLLDGVTHS